VGIDLSSFQMVEMAVFDTSTLTASYQGLNLAANYLIYTGTGFPDDIKILKIYNGGSQGVTISVDGVTRQDYWPAGMTLIVDLQTNHADGSSTGTGTLNGRKGMIIYGLNAGAASVGSLYISGFR